MEDQILTVVYGALAAAVTAAAAYLASWLRAKAKAEKATAVATVSDLVEKIVEREVEATEQDSGKGSTGALKGESKKVAAVSAIESELKDVAKAVGGSLVRAAAGNIGRRIEGAVFRRFGK